MAQTFQKFFEYISRDFEEKMDIFEKKIYKTFF